MPRHVLFVDDDKNVLRGVQRMLYHLDEEWKLHFASSGSDALEYLTSGECDILVTDMCMPGMDGATLLRRVQAAYPDIIRIILSGYSEYATLLQFVRPAHRYLNKPCPCDKLIEALEDAFRLRTFLADEKVLNVLGNKDSLPPLPPVFMAVEEEIAQKNISYKALADIITQNFRMSATIFKCANSPFFGLDRKISNMQQALVLLGWDIIKALILLIHFSEAVNSSCLEYFSLDTFMNHSLATANLARHIACAEEQPKEMVQDCVSSGLLHDLGKLLLATKSADSYKRVLETVKAGNVPILKVEKSVFGVTHAEVGAHLIGLWGFPGGLVEALAFHHDPSQVDQSPGFSPLMAVHLANAWEYKFCVTGKTNAAPPVDTAWLQSRDYGRKLHIWEKKCHEMSREVAENV